MSKTNVFLLAAENSAQLLPLLRSDAALAASQDEHGYSLIHAAASYNHLDLLRALVKEFHVDVDLRDEDGETALFVAETVECATLLVEELGADVTIRGQEGKSALERIVEENDFPQVAVYLRTKELEGQVEGTSAVLVSSTTNGLQAPPPLPQGVTIDVGAMDPDELGDVVDPEFKRMIEELAGSEDFQGPEGQARLRELITQAIRGNIGEEREVRQRTS